MKEIIGGMICDPVLSTNAMVRFEKYKQRALIVICIFLFLIYFDFIRIDTSSSDTHI